ncbi:hypothetical protein [Chitinophaga sp. GbtcB8]|uniref:hypothetical protein n=1 Tax=Chitinophaga sp. GbtcB8 TaxID=2824753 RepID=UPI001C2FC3DB|nr:hypothetical protein [Chitinophaga sp. GbtcB8]
MSFDNYAIDYSVLICTYNPDQQAPGMQLLNLTQQGLAYSTSLTPPVWRRFSRSTGSR